MKALLPTHKQFSSSQTLETTVTVWDTPLTVVSNGIVYRPAAANDSFGVGVDLDALSKDALSDHFFSNTNPGILGTQHTNLLIRSSEFDNATWVKTNTSVTANADTSPDWATSADRLVENTVTSTAHNARQDFVVSSAGVTVTFSCYAKAGSLTQLALRIRANSGTTNWVQGLFDLTAETVTSSSNGTGTGSVSSITDVGNGWYRCVVTGSVPAVTDLEAVVYTASGGVLTYAGTGTGYLSLWGAQAEEGSSASTYLATTTSTATSGEVFGRLPLIHDYWGVGAPLGVNASGRAAIRYSGKVKTAGSYGILFTGRGRVRVFKNGTSILTARITEDYPGLVSYQAFAANDEIEIFFWSLNEPWSGISARVFEDASSAPSATSVDWDKMRESSILSASWMDDGSAVSTEDLSDVSSVSVKFEEGGIPEATVELVLSSSSTYSGWSYDPSTNSVTHNGTGFTVKERRRIRIVGGYNAVTSDELTGIIVDVVPKGDSVTLVCRGFEELLGQAISENYPDRLSYASFGYTDREGISNPVWRVPAYDHWPYEYAIKDMCARAWIDPTILSGTQQIVRYGEASAEDGASLFRCRTLSGQLLRVSRQAHYGNIDGDPDRPADDPYVETSEITESLYGRIKTMLERVGYVFRSNASGYLVLRPTSNPIAVAPLVELDNFGEAGRVWVGSADKFVPFSRSYRDPVVVVTAVTGQNTNRGASGVQGPIVKSVDRFGFTLCQSETSNTGGDSIVTETYVNYIVVEKGVHETPGGLTVEAGTVAATGAYSSVVFTATFASAPAVVASPQTYNETENIRCRTNSVTTTGFDIQVEMGDNATPGGVSETAGYIAIETGSDPSAGIEAGKATSVTQVYQKVNMAVTDSELSSVVATINTEVGAAAAYAVVGTQGNNYLYVEVEEPNTGDQSHNGETISWVSFPTNRLISYGTVHPSASGGSYLAKSATGWTVTATGVAASRIDLVVGRGPTTGQLQVDITRQEGGFTDSFVVDTSYVSDVYYYDNVYDTDLKNICVINLLEGQYYGKYDITITPAAGTTTEDFRLDCLRVFEQDPVVPHPEFQLRTFTNALSTEANFNANDTINDAIVTGQRLSATSGVGDAGESPDTEFVVSRAQDLHSILNPEADNYVGSKITAFLSDEKVISQDLADWAARSLITRYRTPKPDASVRHTALHTIELGDPIYVKDDGFDLFDGTIVMWVNSYTTRYEFGDRPSAITDIIATPFAAVPSYEPREEVDIERFDNKPVINLSISYTGVNGTTQTNPGPDLVVAVSESTDRVTTVQAIANDGIDYLTVAADTVSPGSDAVFVGADAAGAAASYLGYRNNPYYKFYEKASSTRLNLVFEGGDGTSTYNAASMFIGAGQFRDYARYSYLKITDKYSNDSPFYDPYSSDLNPPKMVNVSFDALVSGYYRVSVVDARDRSNPITVAWLTEPSNTDPDGNKHWSYMEAGNDKVFRWGGEDTVGTWNRKHSQSLSWRMRGAFSEVADRFVLSSGVFAQNDSTSPRAHISGEVVSDVPAYNIGQYAQFYIRVECVREDRAEALKVESNDSDDLRDSTGASLTDRYIYYHLPEPNKVTISIEDWDYSTAGAFDPLNPGSSWSSSPDTDATLRDEKPVKITITPEARKGTLFSASAENSYFKLNRVVHLTALNMDTSMIFAGNPWNGEDLGSEEKRVLSRRTSNDEHTIVIKDDSYRNIETTESWIFYPSLFEKDFGAGQEPLEYMNYLQLFDVPMWNPQRHAGEGRSRFLMGYLSYLFYLSVFTQDRSGRMVWAIDPSHADKSKILTNTDGMEFPWDLERHQRRIIYTRQWWDTTLLDAVLADYSVTDAYKGLYADRMDPRDTTTSRNLYRKNNGTTVTGALSTGNQDIVAYQSRSLLPGDYNFNTQFGAWNNIAGTVSTTLGTWSWEQDDFLWIPAPGRDFHPFYKLPPMALTGRKWQTNGRYVPWWANNYVWASTVYYTDGGFYAQSRDEAKFDTWFGKVRNYTSSYDFGTNDLIDNFTTYPGVDVRTYYSDRDGEENSISSAVAQFQKVDDMNCYETSRGGISHGTLPARSPILSVGGDPYYVNAIMYRHFKTREYIWKLFTDVYENGWFQVTFRHAYVWESASLFPAINISRGVPGFYLTMAVDHDTAKLFLTPDFYDAGGWVGWKDDHPSSMQATGAFYDTGTCSELHWRNDIDDEAGGSCTIDNPTVALSDDDTFNSNYTVDRNIFMKGIYTFAVGPRLPETRRVMLGLNLVNERRTVPL